MSSCCESPPQVRPKPAEAAKELLRRRQARRDLLKFAGAVRPDYQVTWFHRLLAQQLQEVSAGRLRRLIVAMPPRHGKTELVSRIWPAWLLGRIPDLPIIACSHTANLAEQISRDVKRILGTRQCRTIFPLMTVPKHRGQLKATDAFWELPTGGTYRAAGVGGPVTGHGFGIGVIDDPFKNREEADSPVVRDRVWEWFTNVFYTRQEPSASIVVTCNRWHRDDLVGRLLRQQENRQADQWRVLTFPAVATGSTPHDPRPSGEALWPERFQLTELAAIQAQDPRMFACLYQQDPGAAGGTEWSADFFGDFIWADDAHWPETFDIKVIAVDPSKGKQDREGDYSAIVFVGVKHGLLWIDASLERRPPHQIVRDTLLWCDRYKPDYVAIETNQFQELLVHEFERVCGQHFGMRWPVFKVDNRVNKQVRIRRLGQYIANREARFRHSPGSRLVVDQLMDFPYAEHDDGPDALEMGVRLILEIAGGGYEHE